MIAPEFPPCMCEACLKEAAETIERLLEMRRDLIHRLKAECGIFDVSPFLDRITAGELLIVRRSKNKNLLNFEWRKKTQ